MRSIIVLLCWLVTVCGGIAAEAARTFSLAAASDLIFALEELTGEFKAGRPGLKVNVTTGASGTLTAQIARGAPYDLFMAADLEYPRQLVRTGHAGSDVVVYGRGHLVLWTMKAELDVSKGLAVLRESAVGRIAIANPDHAPYGRAAKAALVHAELWPAIASKVVLGENVAQAAQFIETGHVDAGIVALSIVSGAKRERWGKRFELPPSTYPPLEQGVILTKQGAQNEDARAFLEYLQTAKARAILKRHGFDTGP